MKAPRHTFWLRAHLLAVRVMAPSLWRRQGEEIRATISALHATADGQRDGGRRLFGSEVAALLRQAGTDLAQGIGSGLGADLRYATRMLAKKPLPTGVMVLTMALGIAANVTVFRAVNQMILQPLPFEQPEQLAMLWGYDLENGRRAFGRATPASYDAWQDGARGMAEFAGSLNGTLTLTALERPESPLTTFITPNFYDLFGVAPLRGRGFTKADAEPGAEPVVVLSYELWQQLGAREGMVGTPLELDGRDRTVIGVMPEGFRIPLSNNPPLIWAPLQMEDWSERRRRNLFVFARLAPGVNFEVFSTAMETVAATMASTYPDTHGGRGARVDALQQIAFRSRRAPVLVLMGAVAFVLLIACVNVANLQVARTLGRKQELGLRLAMGASRARIVRQLLVEATMIAVAGGGLGLLATLWTSPFVDGFMPPWTTNAFFSAGVINSSVLGFTLAAVCTTAFAFGIIPAFALLRTQGQGGSPLRTTEDRGGRRLRRGLTIAEVAISLVLLTGTGLMVRSLVSLRALDPGVNVADLTMMRTGVRGEKYVEASARADHFRHVVEELERIPGVISATAADLLPPGGPGAGEPFERVGGAAVDPGHEPRTTVRAVTAGYFETLGIKIIAGAPFSRADVAGGARLAVVNQTAKQRFWPDRDPVGELIRLRGDEQPSRIVAVVGDVRSFGVPPEPFPLIFVPHVQRPAPTMSLAIRSRPGVEVSADLMQQVIVEAEPRAPVYNISTMAERMEQANVATAGVAQLLAGFAAIALLLVAIGVYAIMSQTVGERFREFGIRMALGAPTTDVMRLVVTDAVRIACWGAVLGVVGSLAIGRALSSLLFAVGPYDPVTLTAVLAGIFALVVVASYMPGRRASRANPADTLKA